MAIILKRWESITIAGTQMGILVESGAIPLIQTSNGSTAMFQSVLLHTIAKKVSHLESLIKEE